MIKHNLCANISADVGIIISKFFKALVFPQNFFLQKLVTSRYLKYTSSLFLGILLVTYGTMIELCLIFGALAKIMGYSFMNVFLGSSVNFTEIIVPFILFLVAITIANWVVHSHAFKRYIVNTRDAKIQKELHSRH